MNEVGIGTRVLNFLIDMTIICLAAYGFYKWYSFYVFYWNYRPLQYYIFLFAFTFVYYFVWEAILTRTPGKFITMTRVRTDGGKRPGVHRIFIRSLTRLIIIDPFFIPFLNRTLHDALSKTKVVEV